MADAGSSTAKEALAEDGDKGDIAVSDRGALWKIRDDAVSFAKIQNIATDRLIGRDAISSGDPEELTVGGGLEFTGAGGVQTSAFSGDVRKSAGGTVLTIAEGAVAYAKLQDASSGFTILARADMDPGGYAELTAKESGVLRRAGSSALAFGPLVAGNYADDSVTYAKLQNVSESRRVLGRISEGTGDVEELSGAQLRALAGLDATDHPHLGGVNLGHASDTTITRTGPGDIAIDGAAVYRAGGVDVAIADGGTGASTKAAAATNLGVGSGDSPLFAGVNLGHASDTQLTRARAGRLAVAGVEARLAGKTLLRVTAQSLTPTPSEGPAPAMIETTRHQLMLPAVDFSPSVRQSAQIALAMPKSWNAGTITARFRWTADREGDVVWGIEAVALSDDAAIDASFGTAQKVTGHAKAGCLMISGETSAVTIGGAAAKGDLVVLKFFRDGADASDTLMTPARLVAVDLFMTTDAANDA